MVRRASFGVRDGQQTAPTNTLSLPTGFDASFARLLFVALDLGDSASVARRRGRNGPPALLCARGTDRRPRLRRWFPFNGGSRFSMRHDRLQMTPGNTLILPVVFNASRTRLCVIALDLGAPAGGTCVRNGVPHTLLCLDANTGPVRSRRTYLWVLVRADFCTFCSDQWLYS